MSAFGVSFFSTHRRCWANRAELGVWVSAKGAQRRVVGCVPVGDTQPPNRTHRPRKGVARGQKTE